MVNGARDIGVWIQDVLPNTPAGRTTLRRCDRVLEVDGKFVDNEASAAIFERLKKAKKKRTVRLYVVDTHTYRYFQEKRVPLPSKDFRKSNFTPPLEPERPTPYINVADGKIEVNRLRDFFLSSVNNEAAKTSIEISRPTSYPVPTSESNYQSSIPDSTNSRNPPEDDIRLCTITRASATDTYGMELNYHRRDHYHSLKISPNLPNASSSKYAG